MVHLSLILMGPFEALLDGQAITAFQSSKVRALLAFLAVEMTRPHPRETLAGLLWPNVPDGCAHHSLNQALSNLRSAIHDHETTPPFLIVASQSLQFNRNSDHWLDVEELGRLVDWKTGKLVGGEEGRLGHAVALYRGPFLEGFSLADSPAFEEWVMLHRERLHRLPLETMHKLADAHATRGEVEQALHYAWRQLELDPWLEEAHLQVMLWLALAGRRSEALAQYSVCRRLLAKELGVEPATATTRLYEQIRHGVV
jgi:DNA-binding SARP family transcriptional activator